MANTLRIKRRPSSGSAGAPSSLFNGELAFNENDNILYYGYGSGIGGVATSFPSIGGSGAYTLLGGTNATGTWPIGITGNAGTVTNGVYTTGDQNINGIKRFTSQVELSGNLGQNLIFKSAHASNGAQIIFDGVNYDGAVQSSYIASNTGNMEIAHGQKIQLNSALEVKAANTAGNSVGYFAVFDSNPNSSLTTLKSVSKDQILDDIGAATSGLNITAGSGLVGGGTLSTDRRFDIGQGDGITVNADSIAVDNTVVRTTGNQTISGTKTFNSEPFFNSGVSLRTFNTSTVSWIAVFDGADPTSNTVPLQSISAGDFLNDININVGSGLLAGINFTAGNGLTGGGSLDDDRTFHVGQGDGITVSADSIAVDSTVVRTTGDQTIAGVKTLSNRPVLNSGLSVLMASTASSGSHFPVFTSDPSSTAQVLASRTPSQVKGDIGLGNVENTSLSSVTFTAGSGLVGGGTLASSRTFDIGQGDGISVSADSIAVDNTVVRSTSINVSGYIPTWAATNGQTLNVGYQVSTSLDTNNSSSFIPRADAVKTYVDNLLSVNDAMVFKGTIGTGGTVTSLPTTYSAGWTYRVITAGTYAGVVCEIGDLIIAVIDRSGSGNLNSDWTVAQTNIDGAVISTRTLTAGSGLTGGGDLSADRTFNIGAGDGITVNADDVAVDSTVVRTTGTQNITGNKNFSGTVVSSGTLSLKMATTASTATQFPVFTSDPSSTAQTVSTRTPSQVKTDIGLSNVENTALSTWAGSTNITTLGTIGTGTWSATTIAANKGGTGQSSYTIGDLLYADTSSTLAKLADVATGNVLLAGGVATAPSWGKVNLTSGTHVSGTLPVTNGGTGQSSYTDGQLLIGNSTGNTLTKATLTEGTGIDITNGGGSITIIHEDTSTLSGAQGTNGIASITVDGLGHVTAVTTATYLTAATVCAAITDCTLDGGTF